MQPLTVALRPRRDVPAGTSNHRTRRNHDPSHGGLMSYFFSHISSTGETDTAASTRRISRSSTGPGIIIAPLASRQVQPPDRYNLFLYEPVSYLFSPLLNPSTVCRITSIWAPKQAVEPLQVITDTLNAVTSCSWTSLHQARKDDTKFRVFTLCKPTTMQSAVLLVCTVGDGGMLI